VDEIFLRVLNRPSRPEEASAARNLVAEIAADHAALTADLAAAEADWGAKRPAVEAERIRRIGELRGSLAEATAAHEPVRLRQERERAERIAKAIAAIEKYHADPEGAIARFESVAEKSPRWRILNPSNLYSTAGAKLETLPDGSVLARGVQGEDTTKVAGKIDLPALTGLRLEVIPDPSLPAGGGGRAADGSFVVTEIGLTIAPASRPGDTRQITISTAAADYSQEKMHVSLAVDGDGSNPGKGWAVSPRQQEPHWAVFETTDANGFKEPMIIDVSISQHFKGGRHGLGRFRLSCTDAAAPVPLGVSARAAELVAIPREQRSAAESAELTAIITDRDPEKAKLAAELSAASKPLPPDPHLVLLAADLADAERPLADDPAVVRLRVDHAESTRQLANSRLTAFQDLAWALINSPAFFFNH
jgi:hypothetical protein